MKRTFTILSVLLMMFSALLPMSAQQKRDVNSVSFSPTVYRVGERLTYNVSFSNFINAAHIELYIAERGRYFDRDGIQLRAHVETTEVINAALYAINNDYTTYIDPGTGQPYRSQQVIREGGRTSDTSSDYNMPLGSDAIPSQLRVGEFPGTYDFLSALYRVRALPLHPRSTYYFNVNYEQIEYKAELKVRGTELIKTKVGSFNTVVTELRANNNAKINDYKVRIYFSDDERHVPVLITARHKVGEIRAELVGSELPENPPAQTTGPVASNPNQRPPQTIPPRQPLNPQGTTTTRPPLNPSGNNNASTATTPLAGLPFNVGEQLNFNVYLGDSPRPVGTSSFQVRARSRYFGREGLLLTVRAQTNGAVARVFTANDQINSYVDPTTLVPFRTELNLQEGRRRLTQILTIDQERGTVITDKGTRIEIPVGTHDLVSVFYALRSFNLTPQRKTAVSLLVNNRPLTLVITSLRREAIEIGAQRLPAIQLSLTTDDAQADRYNLRMWVSDDRRRLPLRILVTTPLGLVRSDLAIIPVAQQ